MTTRQEKKGRSGIWVEGTDEAKLGREGVWPETYNNNSKRDRPGCREGQQPERQVEGGRIAVSLRCHAMWAAGNYPNHKGGKWEGFKPGNDRRWNLTGIRKGHRGSGQKGQMSRSRDAEGCRLAWRSHRGTGRAV